VVLWYLAKRMMTKLDDLEKALAAHNASTGERLATIEVTVDDLKELAHDIDKRVRTLEKAA